MPSESSAASDSREVESANDRYAIEHPHGDWHVAPTDGSAATVCAVEWGNEFPAEIDSLWSSKEEAEQRVAELDAKGRDGYSVTRWQVRDKWEPES